jgi:hypothetical protein
MALLCVLLCQLFTQAWLVGFHPQYGMHSSTTCMCGGICSSFPETERTFKVLWNPQGPPCP